MAPGEHPVLILRPLPAVAVEVVARRVSRQYREFRQQACRLPQVLLRQAVLRALEPVGLAVVADVAVPVAAVGLALCQLVARPFLAPEKRPVIAQIQIFQMPQSVALTVDLPETELSS